MAIVSWRRFEARAISCPGRPAKLMHLSKIEQIVDQNFAEINRCVQ
jgi:hypothetical protein